MLLARLWDWMLSGFCLFYLHVALGLGGKALPPVTRPQPVLDFQLPQYCQLDWILESAGPIWTAKERQLLF